MVQTSTPFGTYTLSPWRESVRRAASATPVSKPGMWMISILRKLALLGHTPGMTGPLDIEVADGVKARLFPGSNRCEKRAFAGVHIWDSRERKVLDQAVAAKPQDENFVFLDVGANVGLYSLFVNASAKLHGRMTTIIAVEPDAENRSRLTFNFAASGCEGIVEPIGIADEAGTGVLTDAGANRGSVAIVRDGDGVSIPLDTLDGLLARHNLDHVDAMKIDIEGRDEAALRAMLENAPQAVWPRLLIVETGREADSALVELMRKYGYSLRERVGINAILEFDPSGGSNQKAGEGNEG